MDRTALLSAARGDTPADLLLRNARVLNVFTGEIEETDIAIVGSRIAGLGRGYTAKQEIDLNGAYVAPGLMDAHVHIESSLCTPPEFAKAVSPRGVTTVVTDPHEIANVCGRRGVQYMIDASRNLPIDVLIMAPSCVPATDLATAGASLNAGELDQLNKDHPAVHGLAEVMNFPGVIGADPNVLAKIDAYRDRPIDGHCPGVRGKHLNAYVAAGIGSDHESITADEAREKLARGLYVLIREATNARNLHALLPLVTPTTNRRFCFCTDDRQPADLLGPGGIDHMVREAIAFGIPPVDAFRLATLNTAEWFGLHDRGAVAPGRLADLMIFDSIKAPNAKAVYRSGALVASDRRLIPAISPVPVPAAIKSGIHVKTDQRTFDIGRHKRGVLQSVKNLESTQVRVIGSNEGQLVTDQRVARLPVVNGGLQSDTTQDILKMAVLERHRGTGNVGLGFIQGLGLKRGAIAGTVAHDHHNLVVIGVDDTSMHTAVRAIVDMGGGLCVADGDRVIATLPLPVAGLMSDWPIEKVRDAYAALIAAAQQLGSTMKDPFMAMSFMCLEVIPSLKLTDRGLVDVEQFKIVSLYV